MSTAPQSKPFNLAIVGGGISGLTLGISLQKHGIPFTIYESASHFGEIGAGVGFEPNFVRTMELISPAMKEGFIRFSTDIKTDPPTWFNVRIADSRLADAEGVVHEKNGAKIKLGEILFRLPAEPGERGGIHRAHFLEQLIQLLPPDVAQFKKRLSDVVEAEDGSGDAVLHFVDGTTAQHTAVIGCDGVKSRTRELVLGKEAGRPVFSGKYAYRGIIPMQEMVEFLGEELPTQPQMYCGHAGHVLTFPIAKGKIFNVVAFSSKDDWTQEEWVVKTTKEEMVADYDGFTDQVKKIMSSVRNPDIWALFDHPPARTFYQAKPRICLVGDAAHASTPHQGAGAGMGIEDCYVLGELLGGLSSADELVKAFQAFDEVRRPRTEKLVATSREAGLLWEFQGPQGKDLDAFEANTCRRMEWVWRHDIREDLERARELMRA